MKRMFSIAFAAMLAGQAWAATTFTSNGLKFTVTDEENKNVSVSMDKDNPLTEVDIPLTISYGNEDYTVTSIASQAFDGSEMTSVVIPNTITDIQNGAFYRCRNLTEINIPNSVKSIGNFAFIDCSGLTEITIPDGITIIGGQTFEGCTSLSSVTIPQSVTKIDFYAFASCTSLSSITIPSSVIEIAPNAFRGCNNLTVMNLDDNNYYSFKSQTIFNKDKTELVSYLNNAVTVYTIPSTVKRIGVAAFCQTGIKSVDIPESVTSIGPSAFSSCNNLTSIKIPNSVIDIEDGAIDDCSQLNSVVLSESVKHIGSGNFSNCPNLSFHKFDNAYYLGTANNSYFALIKAKSTDITSCSINSNCKIIADDAFAGCNQLATVNIPESVTIIGQNVFANCNNLEYYEYDNAFYLGNNETQYIMLVKAKSKDITSCVINDDCQIIGEHAFDGCNQLSSITIPESVTSIGNNAFSSCSGLQLVSIPGYVTSIGESAFKSCSRLVAASVPKTVTSMGENVFDNCSKLTLYCGAESKPGGWSDKWNPDNRPVVWNLGANLWLCTVNVKTNNNAYGSVSGGGIVVNGSTTQITASPKTGYKFVKWSNGLTNAIETITVTKDTTLTAEFAKKTYTVTVSANNSSYGTVGGGGTVYHGSTTTITATPEPGYRFVKWSNGLTNASATITVTKDTTVTAEFAQKVYTVTLLVNNNAYGSVSGGGTINHGSTTTITATPATGYKFIKWSNGLTNASETFTVTSDLTLIAEFANINPENNQEIPENPIAETPADSTSFWFSILSSSEHTAEVSGYRGTSGNVVIPSKTKIDGVEYTVTSIGDQSFRDNSTIVAVTIPNTVTTIKNNAFRCCVNLEYVVIPSSVTTIGEGPFSERNKLTAIYVDSENTNFFSYDGVLYSSDMKKLVQYPCSKSNSVFEIPNGVERVEYGAFSSCPNLISLVLPNSLKTIKWWAISGCGYMQSLVIPNSVTSIEGNGIRYCKNLTIYCEAGSEPSGWSSAWNSDKITVVWGYSSPQEDFTFTITSTNDQTVDVSGYTGTNTFVIIPKKATIDGVEYTVTGVGRDALGGSSISSVNIPSTVTNIDRSFDDCQNLTTINVAEENTAYSSEKDVLFNKDKTTLIRCPEAKSGSYTIPSMVTRIADSAFYNCNKITSITVTDNLTSFGRGAFVGCSNLTFSNQGNASYLGESGNGFYALIKANSTDIAECTINSNCKVIAEDAFQNCSSLSTITIPVSVTHLNKNAFKGCSSLSIKCNAVSQPSGWDSQWNPDNRPVEWTKQWTVTVLANNSAYGSVTGSGIVIDGSTTTITATPATGCKFVKWSNGLTNTNKTITVTSDTALTAVFEVIKYNVRLSANNAAYGIVEGSGTFAYGSTTTVTATPAIGYKFVKWNNGSTKATETITVTSNLTMIAEFAAVVWDVSLSTNNSSYGSVSGGGGITHGSTTTITATPATGYKFVKWSNGSTKATASITVTSDTTLTAVFEIIKYNVTVAANNAAYGTVSGDGSIAYGSTTTVSATPATGYKFVKWSNGSTKATETITITSDLTLTAEFAAVVWNVSLSANNSSYGTVSGGGSIAHGSTTTIIATPADGYKFVKWSNGLTNATETFTVTSDTTVKAEFAVLTWKVSLSANNSSYGTVSEGGSIAHGSTTTITATPADGYKFVKWSNGLTNATETITVISDTTIFAQFAAITWEVSLSANNEVYGSVEGDGTFDNGSTITISATPAKGYKFVKWSNGSTNATETITVTSDMTLTAEFAKVDIIPENPGNQEIPENPIAETPADSTSFLYYLTSSDNLTVEVCGYKGTSGNVVIPAKTTIEGVEYTVTGIGDQAFRDNSTIVSVTIPSTVTIIKSNAFRHCVNLEYVVIPSSVTTIGEGPFSDFNKLTAIYVDNENTDFVSIDGVLYSADMKRLVQYPSSKSNSVFEIPNTVESIEYLAFSSCPHLTSLVLPNSLETIRWWAITGCGKMKSIVIPNSVKTIEYYGIRNCKNLTIYCEAESEPEGWSSLWNNDNLPVVWGYSNSSEDFTFKVTSSDNFTVDVTGYTGSNAHIIIPNKVTIDSDEYTIVSIGDEAFKDCSILKSVTIPSTITSIGDNAFQNCISLESVSLPNTIEVIGACTFAECTSLKSIEIPNSVTFIGNSAFAESGLTSIVIPNSVTDISSYAFQDCADLATIEIPNSVKYIGISAFENCSSLTEVKIPSSVSDIGMAAFKGCSNATFECEAESKPDGWDAWWNYDNRPVAWSDNTSVSESMANAVNIYAFDNTIVVENADDEIFVYDATGRLVCRDAIHRVSAKITVNNAGIYVVKVGKTVKRVIIND